VGKQLLIAGTDTDVGKTVLTAGLVAWLGSKGVNTLAMKPFACGAVKKRGKWIYEDVEVLKKANNSPQTEIDVAPQAWTPPLAPYRASLLEKKPVNFKRVSRAIRSLRSQSDLLLLEGIGGLLCPLTKTRTLADWAVKERLPVLLVARLGLGTLNHTLMTLEVAKARKIVVKGIVLNDFPKTGSDLSRRWNPNDLSRLTKVPVLGIFPHLRRQTIQASKNAWERHFDFKQVRKFI
jgi:dethiobiotin synthetase